MEEKINPYELLYMYRQKDETAYRLLLEENMPVLRGTVKAMLARYPSLRGYEQDLMQEAYLAFDHAVETFREDRDASFMTFLRLVTERRVARICGQLFIRHEMPVIRGGDAEFIDAAAEPNQMLYPEYRMHFNDARRRLDKAIADLPETEKAVYETDRQGLAGKEAAEKLGMTERAYRYRLAKMRGILRKAVGR